MRKKETGWGKRLCRPRCLAWVCLDTKSSGEPVLSESIHLLFIIQLHVQLVVQTTAAIPTQDTDGATGEEYNPLQLLVVEEIVEGPEAAFLPKGV